MKLHSLSNKLAKIILVILFIASLTYLVYWLWQRQPKTQDERPQTAIRQSQLKDDQKLDQYELNLSPNNGIITNDARIKFQGKAKPGEYILIYSNSYQTSIKATPSGNFEKDTELVPGLNIFSVTTLKEDLSQNQTIPILLYLTTKTDPQDAKIFLAGSVKNIFDNLITITTSNGEKTFRQKSSTKLNFPKNSEEDDKDIRVGDYLIALGAQVNEKDFNAQSVEVIRENKPQNLILYASCQLLTAPKSNLFSAKNLRDNKLLEFNLDKNSKIFEDEKLVDNKSIAKDKKAIVFYQNQDGKNLVKTIYLLP